MSASGSAKSRMERIMRLHDQIDEIKGDIREVYAEEKSDGGDKTAMGAAISHLRKRAKDKDAFDEREALAAVYLNAYNGASHTHAREASQSYAEAKCGVRPAQKIEEGLKEAIAVAKGEAEPARWHHAPSELTDTQEQPETTSEIPTGSHDQHHELVEGPEGQLEKEPLANADAVASVSAPIPNPQPDLLPGAGKAGDVLPPSSPASLSDADVPAFLKPEQRKSIADYRPHCLNPDACGATGLTHCYTCKRAMEAASETEAA